MARRPSSVIRQVSLAHDGLQVSLHPGCAQGQGQGQGQRSSDFT